jgi:MFS family permease
MSQGFGGIIGAIVASIIGTSISWRTPFFILGVIGLVLLICYLFIEVPTVGKTEPELKPLLDEGGIYEHKFTFSQIKEVGLKKSNVFLFLQALFVNITTGSLIWIPTLYISKIEGLGFPSKTAIIAASFLYGIFQIGGLTSTYFGHIGDQIQRKTLKGRAMFTGSVLFLMIPFYFLLFSLPMKNLELPADHNSILILLMLLKQFFFNQWMFILLVISFVASAVQSANTPNWLALITDVNLPEHRAVVFSIGNLMNSIGRTIGNVGVGLLLPLFSNYLNQQESYIYTLSTLLLFIIPASLCYLFMAKRNVEDIKDVKYILSERVKKLKANE